MSELNNFDKWKYSIYTLIIFIIVVNPYTYKLTNFIFTKLNLTTTIKNCPTTFGLILHSIVFLLLTRGIMEIPNL